MPPIRTAIHGAAGRMGRRLVALASADDELAVVAALEAPNAPHLGEDAGTVAGVAPLGVKVVAKLEVPVDVVIDFSVPGGTEMITKTCLERKIPLVVATTGLNTKQQQQLREAAQTIPVLWSPSMSPAVNLAMKMVDDAARVLSAQPGGADVEIIERHHRFKEDAPSGTALKFGQIIAARMGQTEQRHGREGRVGQRSPHEIAFHAVRQGDNPGEHTIIFGMLGETLEVSIRASNRDCYAHGALAAAKFLVDKPPGLYDMEDVLGL